MRAKVIEVIEATYKIGDGTEDSPFREKTVYLTLDGEHLAEVDAWKTSTLKERVMNALLVGPMNEAEQRINEVFREL